MTPRSAKTAPSSAVLRMQRSRARRRQGDVIVSLEIEPSAISDLVALGWLHVADCGSKDAVARALLNLIEQAVAMRVTPAGSEGICLTPLRATVAPSVIGSDEEARRSPKVGMPADPGLALGAADGAPEFVEGQHSTAKPSTQLFVVDPVEMWTPRLDLYKRAHMWMPGWGPRPGQVGCSAPEELLEAYGIRRPGLMEGLSSGI